jgi:1,4-alpha-glucan branching enzyme
MWTHPGKKLLFMGSEIAQWHEWDYDSQVQWDLLAWDTHAGVKRLVADLNKLVIQQPALHQLDFSSDGFEWIDCMSAESSVIAYLRKAEDPEDFVVVACNFTPVVRHGYQLGVPRAGYYRELFNSDSAYYAGGNLGNYPGVMASQQHHHGRPASLQLNLPPLAVVVLKPE